MTEKAFRAGFIAIFVIAGLALTLYFGEPRAHPGAIAALGLGLVLWFFVDLPQPDMPFGMVLGGAVLSNGKTASHSGVVSLRWAACGVRALRNEIDKRSSRRVQ